MHSLFLTGGGNILTMVLYFVVIMALMYFLMIRPQKKRQEAHKQMMEDLQVGTHVVTIGGLHGIVHEIDSTRRTITLDCEGIFLVFDRNAIGRTINANPTSIMSDELTATGASPVANDHIGDQQPAAKADYEEVLEPEVEGELDEQETVIINRDKNV